MRTRLTKTDRRQAILLQARRIILERGFDGTEMEDIRLACGISRGGLYHHFGNKRAVLGALVSAEVEQLVEVVINPDAPPISALLEAGSIHLGQEPGILSGMTTRENRLDYLSCLEQAQSEQLREPLRQRLRHHIQPDVEAAHIAELFLTITAHINRRDILSDWSAQEAAGFSATALTALKQFLKNPSELDPIIQNLSQKACAP